MWNPDMNCCINCPAKDGCQDRKKILQTLSKITNELNHDLQHVEGPGDGIIIVACNWKPAE